MSDQLVPKYYFIICKHREDKSREEKTEILPFSWQKKEREEKKHETQVRTQKKIRLELSIFALTFAFFLIS